VVGKGRSRADEFEIEEAGDGGAGGVGEEVGPEEGVAEDEGGGFEGADLVDPGCVIELGEFDEGGEGEGEGGDFERGQAREEEGEEAVGDGGPRGVAGVGDIPGGEKVGREEAGGEADDEEEGEEEEVGEDGARGGGHGAGGGN
jgi:hypothetical protein